MHYIALPYVCAFDFTFRIRRLRWLGQYGRKSYSGHSRTAVTKQKAECLFRAGKNTLQQRYIRDESMVEYAYSFRFE